MALSRGMPVAALVAAASLVWLVHGMPVQRLQPHFDRVEQDFGSTRPGQPLQTSFVVANRSQTALQIEKIVPSCGCMTHDVSPALIAPGESREIRVEIDTSRFVAPTDLSKTVAVTLGWQGRPDKETTFLRLNAQLRDALSPARPVVSLSAAGDRQRFLGEVRIARDGLTKDDFATLSIRDAPPNVHCQIRGQTSDTAMLRCWTADPDALVGQQDIHLAFQWDGVACDVKIPCRLETPSDVVATPSCLILTQGEKKPLIGNESNAGEQIRLASHGGGAVEIVDVAFDDRQAGEWFVCERDVARPSVLNVRLAESLGESLVATKLTISYRLGKTAGEVRRLQVPLYLVAGKVAAAEAPPPANNPG